MSEAGFNNKIEKLLSDVWPDWQIDKKIGQGATGTVYKAFRKEQDVQFCSAIKVISIPEDSSEVEGLRYEGYTKEQTRTYLKEIVHSVIDEVKMLSSLRGAPNIVQIEDYKVLNIKNEDKWIIFIRMELLTPLNEYICDKDFTEADIIKLGVDVCKALTLCSKKGIIHRDIKPENIFVNEFGDYKIGDFGISKQLENLGFAMSQKGSFGYVAPEVLIGGNYDATVDTYSLGVVMYKILNNNRLPFLDKNKQILSAAERQQATERRIKGEKFPELDNVSTALSKIINKACEFDPLKRFESPEKMQKALEDVTNNKDVLIDDVSDENQSEVGKAELNNSKKNISKIVITAFVLLGAILLVIIVFQRISYNDSEHPLTEYEESGYNPESAKVEDTKAEDVVDQKEIYEKADQYIALGMYKKAYEYLVQIEGYEDSDQLLKECAYNAGIDCLIECDYDKAKQYLAEVIFDEDFFNNRSQNAIYEVRKDDQSISDEYKESCLNIYDNVEADKVHILEMNDGKITKIYWKWMSENENPDSIIIDIDYKKAEDEERYYIGVWFLDSELNVNFSSHKDDYIREDWIYDLYSKERR